MSKDVYNVGEVFEKESYADEGLPAGEYEACRFVDCNFENTNLSMFKFIECEFVRCNLSLVRLSNTSLSDAVFKDCKMLGLHFEHCNSFNLSFRFENCTLDHSSFYKIKMKNTVFNNSKVVEVDFTDTILSGSIFSNYDLQGTKFENTKLDKVDFRTSYNYSFDPETNVMKKAKFSLPSVLRLLDKYDIDIS